MRRIIRDPSECPASRHDRVGYQRYGCRCDDALTADRRYRNGLKRDADGRSTYASTVGSARRIRAMQRQGYTIEHIAAIAGLGRETIRAACVPDGSIRRSSDDIITGVYNRVTVAAHVPNRKAASIARGRGLHGPWCWTDDTIDDPAGVPLCQVDDDAAAAQDYDTALLLDRIERGFMDTHGIGKVQRRILAEHMWRKGYTRTTIAGLLNSSGTRINALVDADR